MGVYANTVVPLKITEASTAATVPILDAFLFLVSNHQFNWWFILGSPKGHCYCSPQRAVSQALLLVRYKVVLLESSRFLCLLIYIFLNCCICYIADCFNIISSSPKGFIPFTLQFWMSVVKHQCALPFQISHKV